MKKLVAFDIECLPNYFLVVFQGVDSRKIYRFELFGEGKSFSEEEIRKLRKILRNYTTFGFNSIKYDLPMLSYAITGKTCAELYKVSARLTGDESHWDVIRDVGINVIECDHFDVSEPAPAVMISLKNYGTRCGSKKLQEFFVEHDKPLDKSILPEMVTYCDNDTHVTIDLYNAIKDRIDLRISMGERYGLDLRSKSDAQIAEVVISSELRKMRVDAVRPNLPLSYRARYKAPAYIKFDRPDLQELVKTIEAIPFTLASNGQLKMPTVLANKKIVIGDTTYKLGIGGLHSQEKRLVRESNDTHVMRNADFSSYYPFIILKNRLYPKHLGRKFLDVYESIVTERLAAKKRGDSLVADSLKITINGSFGKFGSKYSKLYSPDLLLATTITGQLTLLMLIEQFEAKGIPVVSANTDGMEYYCPRDKVDIAEAIVFDLELVTGYEMEHGEYEGLYARDVNNYVAKYKGKTKSKGVYAENTLSKGLQTPIVFEAVRRYILDGSRMEDTIHSCTKVNDFLSARTVKGGAVWNGEYLGKMVRWYYCKGGHSINYKSNGNLVPKTGEGVRPMMDLTDSIPSDLDYDWYVREAIAMLNDLGVAYEKEA